MKKKTNKQLLAEAEQLRKMLSDSQAKYAEADKRADQRWSELREIKSTVEDAERRANDAREEMNAHRARCLEYFMCIANPETAKDVEHIKTLQAAICGTFYQPQRQRFQ